MVEVRSVPQRSTNVPQASHTAVDANFAFPHCLREPEVVIAAFGDRPIPKLHAKDLVLALRVDAEDATLHRHR